MKLKTFFLHFIIIILPAISFGQIAITSVSEIAKIKTGTTFFAMKDPASPKAAAYVDLSFLNPMGFAVPNADGIYEIPFIDRMGFVFLICVTGMYFISIYENKKGVKPNGLEVDKTMFRMSPSFTVGMLIITAILAALYTVFW